MMFRSADSLYLLYMFGKVGEVGYRASGMLYSAALDSPCLSFTPVSLDIGRFASGTYCILWRFPSMNHGDTALPTNISRSTIPMLVFLLTLCCSRQNSRRFRHFTEIVSQQDKSFRLIDRNHELWIWIEQCLHGNLIPKVEIKEWRYFRNRMEWWKWKL